MWDSFRAHLTDEVKAELNRRKIDVAVIHGGLTPVLQPLDKCLNKPFKDNVRRKYLAWMISSLFDYTPAGKKAPSRNLVLWWVHEAWREIPVEMVAKSFKTCGIANCLDGTEDEELYTEEAQEIDDDEEDNEFETERRRERWRVNCLSLASSSKNGSFRSHHIHKSALTNNFILSLTIL